MMILTCKRCGEDKEAKHFSPHIRCKSGYDISRCKKCKKSLVDWEAIPLEKRMYNRTKFRAKKFNREFSISLEDIVFPTHCPIFGRPFIYGDHDWTYSIDRIDNSKGYIKGNIVIVSNKANRLKNDASIDDLKKIVEFYNNCEVV